MTLQRLFLTGILLTTVISLSTATCPYNQTDGQKSNGQIIPMNNELFIQQIFDYSSEQIWKFKGNKPVVIDFYATWCGPCRQVAPLLKELAKEYKDRITIYKVDTDEEQQLTAAMGIRSLPTIVFIPVKGQPQLIVGAADKVTLKKAIEEVLLQPSVSLENN